MKMRKLFWIILMLFLVTLLALGGCQKSQENQKVTDESGTIELKVNTFELNIELADGVENEWFDVKSIAADAPNIIEAVYIPQGVSLTIDGQQVFAGESVEITVEHMGKDIGIPVAIFDERLGKTETCYIRTLNHDLPEIDYYVKEDALTGVYYTSFQGWLVKWDSSKKEYVYFNNIENDAMDFKCTEIDGKVFYSYLQNQNVNSRPNYITTGGYTNRSLKVMDENYILVDEVDHDYSGAL